ncbi:polyphosphate kinase 1 [Flocculibacter collagenilyticus]|uniref:polyphosphate kinase 1 n=1 Tax=Flocculibacter collagenilyticus TaxID=2744479 RepID=UPI0018F533D2|nr:polyphosphate kinase 1 [Flocculibacter collagenilyticus]
MPNDSQQPFSAQSVTSQQRYFPKELSWLSFNERVLQEAEDPVNPVIERVRFLGIFSSNLDEFFRVRVSQVKRKILLGNLRQSEFDFNQEVLLNDIQKKVLVLHQKFNQIFEDVMKELTANFIEIVSADSLSNEQSKWLAQFFKDKVLRFISPIIVTDALDLISCLEDHLTYFFVEMDNESKQTYAVIEIPSEDMNRFVQLPTSSKMSTKQFILLDDVVCHFLHAIFKGLFQFERISAYSFKVTRDAAYDIKDEVDEGILGKISKSLKQRLTAEPVRAVYEQSMPERMLKMLKKKLKLTSYDSLTAGGHYRNFKDFINFPNIGKNHLEFPKLPAIESKAFTRHSTVFEAISQSDILLYYPYHKFKHFTEFIRQASFDPKVTHIRLNIYRVAKKSRIIGSLKDAVRNGKQVTVVVELRARFDEEANIQWARVMQEAGVTVLFGIPSLKVHCKLCLVTRKEKKQLVNYAHIGTGNFHEKNAKIYTDFSLFTKDPFITQEVDSVFKFISHSFKRFEFKHLLLSPLNARDGLNTLIDNEISQAKQGKPSGIKLKVNNLVDKQLIDKLYEASSAGVPIKLLVRGMVSLVPNIPNVSENITVMSIVDRFLEHPRVMVFENNGSPKVFISSADWMRRNIDERVEVAVPIYNEKLKTRILDLLDIQFNDTVKARVIDSQQQNCYLSAVEMPERQAFQSPKKAIRSQVEIYNYIKRLES